MKSFLVLFIWSSLIAQEAIAGHQLENRDIWRGKLLYSEQCASCHGKKLEGQPNWQTADSDGILPAPPHDASGHTWHHGNELLFNYTKFGGEVALRRQGVENFKSGMPGFSDQLTDDEIWDVLSFIHSTWPERIQEFQATRNQPH